MQTNSWILKLTWIHLQAARSVVSFLCLRMCLQMQDLNLVFILWDLDQYPRVSFLKELILISFLSRPRCRCLPRAFQRPAKKRLLCRNVSPFWKRWRLPELTGGHPEVQKTLQGCLTVLARIQVGWLLSLEEPGQPTFLPFHCYPPTNGCKKPLGINFGFNSTTFRYAKTSPK